MKTAVYVHESEYVKGKCDLALNKSLFYIYMFE